MKFRNVKVPEGINVSRHSPLGDLVILSAGAAAIFVTLAIALWYFGGALARYMPIRWENALADVAIGDKLESAGGAGHVVEEELQRLADRLGARMDLPADMRVRVHYIDSDIVNATAWLGGHVFMFRGLLRRMPNENALAMVMGHEIAHAANRDALANVGGMILSQLFLAVALGSAPTSLEQVLYGPNALLLRGFSRVAERRADDDALTAVAGLYGHVAGATRLFEVFLEEAARQDLAVPEFLSTHPLSENRIARIGATARERGWPLEGPITPLSPVFAELGEAAPTRP